MSDTENQRLKKEWRLEKLETLRVRVEARKRQ